MNLIDTVHFIASEIKLGDAATADIVSHVEAANREFFEATSKLRSDFNDGLDAAEKAFHARMSGLSEIIADVGKTRSAALSEVISEPKPAEQPVLQQAA